MLMKALWLLSFIGCDGLNATIRPKEVVAPEEPSDRQTEPNHSNRSEVVDQPNKSRVVVLANETQTQLWIEGNPSVLFRGNPELFWNRNRVQI